MVAKIDQIEKLIQRGELESAAKNLKMITNQYAQHLTDSVDDCLNSCTRIAKDKQAGLSESEYIRILEFQTTMALMDLINEIYPLVENIEENESIYKSQEKQGQTLPGRIIRVEDYQANQKESKEIYENYENGEFRKTGSMEKSSPAEGDMQDNILIVTVTKTEVQAVRDVFLEACGKEWIRIPNGTKTYYNLGKLGGVLINMVVSEMGSATRGGSILTVAKAIDDLKPQAVIMCGIAFGLRPGNQILGDILISKQLEYYEVQKVDQTKGILTRADRTQASDRLIDRFRGGDYDWKGANTHFGLILSGEKLINDASFRDELLKLEPEAIGGEMEGGGLYAAASQKNVEWILVKGICDWADGNKDSKAQPMAARNAAQFVCHVIRLGGWKK